jgi:hypothetical protein
LSDNTLTLTFVFELTARTNAPSNGAPSGPFTVPVTVAAKAEEEKKTKKTKEAVSL